LSSSWRLLAAPAPSSSSSSSSSSRAPRLQKSGRARRTGVPQKKAKLAV
jgi:hypothetical protein